MPQLVLHTGPYAAQVHRIDPVEDLRGLVGGVAGRGLNAGVVERHVQPAEGRNGLVDHRSNLLLIGHVAGDAQHLVPAGPQVLDGISKGVLVDVSEPDSGASFGERLRGGQPHARTRAGDQRDLPIEVIRRIHRILHSMF